MTAAILLGFVISVSGQNAPQTKAFEFPATNLKFNHPADWQIKKVKGDFRMTIPLKDGKSGLLELYAVSFMAAPEVWENAQKFFAESQKLRVLSQTREELLGVPMLMYRLQETATPERKITLSGLVYAATEFKLQYRLTAPETVFPDAEFLFRQSLQSIGTVDGRLPEPERPGRATEAPATKRKPLQTPDRSITRLDGGQTAAPKIEQNSLNVTVAGKPARLGVPKAWSLAEKDGQALATHASWADPITIRVVSSLESATLTRALSEAASNALGKFTSVAKREETVPRTNLVGMRVMTISREGTSEGGPLAMLHAGGEKDSMYWMIEIVTKGPLTKAQRDVLMSLINGTGVEAAP